MGVVYEAWDKERNIRVALKTLSGLDQLSLRLFKNEFRALADLSHPNLATLFELFSEDGQWYFSMEYVEGVHFLEYVCPGRYSAPDPSDADKPLDPDEPTLPLHEAVPDHCDRDRLRNSLEQLVDAVSALHAGGILHRDLKPANVKITPEGRLVVLDFGLAARARSAQFEDNIAFAGRVGTLSYMSPEQAEGDPVTEATDWYSVGVMIYEALAGTRPFTGTAGQVLENKKHLDAPPLRLIENASTVPAAIWADICAGLLERNPDRRMRGADLLSRLNCQPLTDIPQPPPLRTADSIFVGRESHLATLRESFAATDTNVPSLAFVHGKSGIGKSSLIDRFLRELGERQRVVILAGRCYERESMPYKAFDSVVDSLARYLTRLPQHEAAELTPRNAATLVQIFPVLRHVQSISDAPRRTGAQLHQQELRRLAFGALRELFSRLSDRHSVVLCIDDLQWGDTDSAALLKEILRPPEAPPILIIGAYRDGYEGRSPFLDALRKDSPAGTELRDLPVGPLTEEESRALALWLLEPGDTMAAQRIAAITHESEGTPYFIQELSRRSQTSSADAGTRSATLDSMVYQRVTELDPDAQRLLEIVAVAGRPVDQGLLCRAVALEQEGPRLLAALRAGRLVRGTSAGEIEPYHDRVREAIVSHLPLETLRQLNLRLANTLQSTLGAGSAADTEAVAGYFEGAGLQEKAGPLYAAAADQAAKTLAFKHAAALYRRALDLHPSEHPARTGLLIKVADALANAGHGAEAARAYGAAAVVAPPERLFELERKQAYWFAATGYVDEGREAFQVLLARVKLRLPDRRFVLPALAFRELQLLFRGLGFQERAADAIPRPELDRIDAAWDATRGLGMIDVPAGIYFTTRCLLLSLQAGEISRIAQVLVLRAVGAASLPTLGAGRSKALLAKCGELAARAGTPLLRAWFLFGKGFVNFLGGNWIESGEQLREAESIFSEECPGASWEMATAHIFSLWDDFYSGRLNELRKRVSALGQAARERGDLYEATMIGGQIQVLCELAAGRPAAAKQMLDGALNEWTRNVYTSQSATSALVRTRLLLYTGEGQAAWDFLMNEWPLLKKNYYLRLGGMRQWLFYARAQCALAVSPPLLNEAERAAKQLEKDDVSYAHALGHIVRAACALKRGDKTRALAVLPQAVAKLKAAGLMMHAIAAERALAALNSQAVTEAEHAMQAEGVVDPMRFSAMLVSGLSEL